MNRRRIARKQAAATTVTQSHNHQEHSMQGVLPMSPPQQPPSSVLGDKRRPCVQEDAEMLSGRERLLRHRVQVAGKVWIPEVWGKEEFLKEWRDVNAFDRSLMPNGLVLAKSALAGECSRMRQGVAAGMKGCGSSAMVLTELN